MPPAVAPSAVSPEMQYHGIFVKNLPPNTTENGFRNLFAGFGDIRSQNLRTDWFGASMCEGTVQFIKPEAARTALRNYNGKVLHGRFHLEITYDTKSLKPVLPAPPTGSAPAGPAPATYGGVSTLPTAGLAGTNIAPTSRRPGAPPAPPLEPLIVTTPLFPVSGGPIIVTTPDYRKRIRVNGIGSGVHWGLVQANMAWYSGRGSHKIVDIARVDEGRGAIIEFTDPKGAQHAMRRLAGEDFGAGNPVQLNLF